MAMRGSGRAPSRASSQPFGSASPRPNELSDMGRVNAAPAVGLGRSTGGRTAGAVPRVIGFRATGPVLAALVWFAMNLLTDVLNLGPDVDLATYAGTILVTAFAAVLLDRTNREDLGVALAATLGYVVSSPVGRPEHHTLDGTFWTGVISGLVVFGAIVVLRRLLGRPIRT